ncbi:hypothetical protein V6N13_116066 [Hibiscus sabdariffa]|uniref:Uncharacterized protein n=2 Tax=Hibiscus sabdariffa TaxID=183260 RepID=A0ABR2NCS6_9ROSI
MFGIVLFNGDSVSLYEVQIEEVVGSMSYSIDSFSIKPVLDPVSGLYSIKPKLVKPSKLLNPLFFRSRLEKFQRWASLRVGASSFPVRSHKEKSKERSVEPFLDTVEGAKLEDVMSSERLPGSFVKVGAGSNIEEAKKAVEVCNCLGLLFKESDKVVSRRLVEVVRQAKDQC